MCNCNNSYPCNQCQSGLPCNCPPQFPVVTLPVPCGCCPSGYTYTGITPNYPNGSCTQLIAPFAITPSIPCVNCDNSTTTDCVTYNCTSPLKEASNICAPCVNVAPGDNLTTIIQKICPTNPAVILQMLQVIAADTTYGLKQAWCDISNYCSGIPGSLTPYIGPISFTIP